MGTKVSDVSKSKGLTGIVFAAIIACACATFCLMQPTTAQAAQEAQVDKVLTAQASALTTQDYTHTYTLGTTIGTASSEKYVGSENDEYYTFTVNSPGVEVAVTLSNLQATNCTLYGYIEDANGRNIWSGSAAATTSEGKTVSTSRTYLPKGSYKMHLYCMGTWINYNDYTVNQNVCKYSFRISKVADQKVTIAKKSGKFKVGSDKQISLAYNSTDGYAQDNLKVAKNTKKTVATASLSNIGGKSATLTITPKKMGKTVISVKLDGGNTVTYTVYVTNATAFLAKGTTTSLTKPIGVSGVKFANKSKASKKVALTTAKGKVTAKKQGRAAINAKKSGITYSYNVVVTDYTKLAKKTYNLILEYVPNPDEVKINYAYKGYYKISGIKVPVVYVDYSFGNETGGNSRNKLIAWYDDALDVQMQNVATANNVISKKSIKI